MVATPVAQPLRVSLAEDARTVAWWVLVGAAAGAIAGFVIGGIGGRLAMLLLRLTSPDSVRGLTSDDGFVIGQFSVGDSLNLAMGMAMLGGMNGVLYAVCRTALPARARLPVWIALAALVGGSLFVHSEGVDFTVLEPASLAIALFVALPALAAAVVVLLVERLSRAEPWEGRGLVVAVCLCALAATFALVLVAVVIAVAVLVRRVPVLAIALRRAGPILVPLAIAFVGVVAGVDLIQESRRILD